MTRCPKCGKRNEANSRYCENCGTLFIKRHTLQPKRNEKKNRIWAECFFLGCFVLLVIIFLLGWVYQSDSLLKQSSERRKEEIKSKAVTLPQETNADFVKNYDYSKFKTVFKESDCPTSSDVLVGVELATYSYSLKWYEHLNEGLIENVYLSLSNGCDILDLEGGFKYNYILEKDGNILYHNSVDSYAGNLYSIVGPEPVTKVYPFELIEGMPLSIRYSAKETGEYTVKLLVLKGEKIAGGVRYTFAMPPPVEDNLGY